MSERREEKKAKVFAEWYDTVKNGLKPEIDANISALDRSEFEETVSLLRFNQAIANPSIPSKEQMDKLRNNIFTEIEIKQKEQFSNVDLKKLNIIEFGDLVTLRINSCKLNRAELASQLGIHYRLLHDIEVAGAPPIRLPLDSMINLLNKLKISSKDVLELINDSTLKWILSSYPKGESTMARIDLTLSDIKRKQLLDDGEQLPEDVTREIQRLNVYIEELSKKIK
jgi:hypothetical protein